MSRTLEFRGARLFGRRAVKLVLRLRSQQEEISFRDLQTLKRLISRAMTHARRFLLLGGIASPLNSVQKIRISEVLEGETQGVFRLILIRGEGRTTTRRHKEQCLARKKLSEQQEAMAAGNIKLASILNFRIPGMSLAGMESGGA